MGIKQANQDVILKVYVKPRSRNFNLIFDGSDITISCREKPVKGKVNRELIRELSRLFHKEVELLSGSASRKKAILIRHIEEHEVRRILLQSASSR